MSAEAAEPPADLEEPDGPRICPCCGAGLLMFVRQLSPKRAKGP
jgi:hypothetical protein